MAPAPSPVKPETAPPELPSQDTGEPSSCTIISDGGPGVTCWSLRGARTATETSCEVRLQLSPDAPVIIGRQDGGEIEYLDPRYVPSPIMPDGRQTVLKRDGTPRDLYVSRGHFMLRGSGAGIRFINGVPRRGGGVRPPKNWTQLLAPQRRMLHPAEELVIQAGESVTICLPNDTRLTIQAGFVSSRE
jgi:hypothetical protein